MKLNINKVLLYTCLPLLAGGLASCENSDNDFPDYEGGVSVYFANQYPVRTIVLGEDEYDTSRDNAHQCQLQATMGGSYTGKNIKVQIAVDNDLCNNLYFADGVTPIDGKREAKSVVTRFSTFKHRDDATERYSTAHPVVVKLLSVADIAAILCDSYHSDLLDKQFYADDEVKGIVDNIYSRYITLQEVPQAILTEDDILDIRAYLAKYVKDEHIIVLH